MNIEEHLVLSTVKITTNRRTRATGFFYKMNKKSEEDFEPVIVSNRHVFKNTKEIKIVISLIKDGVVNNSEYEIINIQETLMNHPNKEVDLAMIPIGSLIKKIENEGFEPNIRFIDKSGIPNKKEEGYMSPIEDVIMIGYPTGISDDYNNRPIVRKGITATDFKLDYKEKPQFLIDCPVFGGSSGSPVFLFSKDPYDDGKGNLVIGGTRIMFLGILASGPTYNLKGALMKDNVNCVDDDSKVISRLPMGLGHIFKSKELFEFEQFFSE